MNRRFKVVHITEAFDGGVVTFLRHVLPAQRARGLDVSLLCSPRNAEHGAALEELERAGVRTRELAMCRTPHPWRDARALVEMIRILRAERASVVHTHCFKAGVLGRVAARLLGGLAVVHTPHCWTFLRCNSRLEAWAGRVLERWLERWTDALVLVSESQQAAASASGIGKRCRVAVVANASPAAETVEVAELSALRAELGLDPCRPIVGTVCRLIDYKCVDHFIQAAARVRSVRFDAVFLVIGSGPHRSRLEHLAASLGVQNTVRFLGFRDDARQLLKLMNVCVLCSRAEGLPYVLLEARAAGVPVVASDVPGNSDAVKANPRAVLYPWGDTERLSQSILAWLQADAVNGCAPEEHFLVSANVETQVDELVQLYGKLSQSARGSTGGVRTCSAAPAAKDG